MWQNKAFSSARCVWCGNLRHFWLRGAFGVANKGNSIDPEHFVGKYKAFSSVRCFWCGKERYFYRSGAFFR